MKKKVVTAFVVLTILKGISVGTSHIVFAVDEDKKIAEKDEKISELRAQEEEIRRNIYVIEEQITGLQREIEHLQEELEEAQEELDRLKREIVELKSRINRRHKHIEKNARRLQLHKGAEWLNYLKVIFDKGSNWSQKISALTSIRKVMSSQKGLIEQQEKDYTTLQNKEAMANERVALICVNLEEIQRNREELERFQTDLEIKKSDLEIMRASEEADREVLIVKREAAQRAAIEVEERQKREFEERAYAVKQKEGQMTAMAAVTSRPITLVAPITPVARSSSNSNYSSGGGGQCTDYATAKTGIGGLGNASQWAANAQSKGYNVSKTPKAGDVVVFAPGQAGASSLGHVGVVDSVNENGTINMSEANYNGGFNKRTVSSAAADGFISSN